MADLKPCPFCGSPWVQVRWIGFKNAKYHSDILFVETDKKRLDELDGGETA